MTGDGTNDAPALAQADVGVAMNTGTQAAKEAGNMVDLDSNPTKLIEIVEIGKQLLITRGALTTFRCQRRSQIFRDYSGHVRGGLPTAECFERDAPSHAAIRNSFGGNFQCVDHHRADSAGAARRALPSAGRGGVAAAKCVGLWSGRRNRALYRDQIDRRADSLHAHGVRAL